MSAKRDRQARACLDIHDFLMSFYLPPHLAPSRKKEPYFLNRFVRDRSRGVAGRKLEMSHSASPKTEQDTDVGTIRSDGISLDGQPFGLEFLHLRSFMAFDAAR